MHSEIEQLSPFSSKDKIIKQVIGSEQGVVSQDIVQQEPNTNGKEHMPQLETVTPEEVTRFVSKNRMKITKGVRCVDGGYKPQELSGEWARPGGDLGFAMMLLGMGYSPSEAFEAVYQYVTEKEDRAFYWHTDTHADSHDHGAENGTDHSHAHEKPVIGCGHCNAAIKYGEIYGVDGEQVHQLQHTIRDEQKKGVKKMVMVNLEREHAERAVLLNTGTEYTIAPWDMEANEQFFIYDVAKDKELLSNLTDFLMEKGMIEVQNRKEFEKLRDSVVDQHNNSTLGLLKSSQNKELIVVNADNQEQPFVEKLPDRIKPLS